FVRFMGPPGSGKSYFIDILTGQPGRRNGSSLKPVTSQVEATRVRHPKYGNRIVLVDFPSFDDFTGAGLEILQMISDWLRKTYERNVKLSGIIYLHRITDNRVARSPLMNLELFGPLCGDIAMSRVLIVSTMWEKVQSKVGTSRESELKDRFWKPFIEMGARIERLEGTDAKEAWRVIEVLARVAHKRKALLIQEELVGLERSLRETMAGRALYGKLQKHLINQRETIKHLRAQIEESDDLLTRTLRKECQGIERNLERTLGETKRLRIT
ncbi:hypothetical protein P691DRAFT_648513, partial [Macrolepiota fuliginosa MF-IS2]